jgi:hypothetical protein
MVMPKNKLRNIFQIFCFLTISAGLLEPVPAPQKSKFSCCNRNFQQLKQDLKKDSDKQLTEHKEMITISYACKYSSFNRKKVNHELYMNDTVNHKNRYGYMVIFSSQPAFTSSLQFHSYQEHFVDPNRTPMSKK